MKIRPVVVTTQAVAEASTVDHGAAIKSRHGTFAKLVRAITEGFGEGSTYVDDTNSGAAVSTFMAIGHEAVFSPGSAVLFFEDDVEMCPEAPAIIKAVASDWPDDVGVISFCDMREIPSGSDPGLYHLNALGSDRLGWWGNQCLLIHPDVVTHLANSNWFSAEICSHPGIASHVVAYQDHGLQCSDKRMSLVVHSGPRPLYAVHVPSLVKHVGQSSICFGGRTMGERETRNLHPYWQKTTTTRASTLMTMAEYHQGASLPSLTITG